MKSFLLRDFQYDLSNTCKSRNYIDLEPQGVDLQKLSTLVTSLWKSIYIIYFLSRSTSVT